MAKKIKISRKEIRQPDEFLSWSEHVINYVQENLAKVFAGVAALLAVVLAVQGINYYFQEKDNAAKEQLGLAGRALETPLLAELTQEQLNSGNKIYNNEQERNDAAIGHLEALMKDHSGSEAAKAGYYMLAKTYFSSGEYQRAVDTYEKFMKTKASEETALKAGCLLGIGSSYYNMKKYDKALEYFDKTAKIKDAPNRKYALLAQARAYEQKGELDRAIELLKKSEEEYPKLVAAEGIAVKIEMLEQAKLTKTEQVKLETPGQGADDLGDGSDISVPESDTNE